MSKNNVVVAPELGAEVAESVLSDLLALPEYATYEQAIALQAEAKELEVEAKRIESKKGNDAIALREIQIRAGQLQRGVLNGKADAKSTILNSQSITHDRATFEGRFGKWLEARVEEKLKENPKHLEIQAELTKLVVEAETLTKNLKAAEVRIPELRQACMGKEKEAQLLLESISL